MMDMIYQLSIAGCIGFAVLIGFVVWIQTL